MEVSQLIELMNAVSEAGLTDFCYEENGVSVKIKKHPEKKIVGVCAGGDDRTGSRCSTGYRYRQHASAEETADARR